MSLHPNLFVNRAEKQAIGQTEAAITPNAVVPAEDPKPVQQDNAEVKPAGEGAPKSCCGHGGPECGKEAAGAPEAACK